MLKNNESFSRKRLTSFRHQLTVLEANIFSNKAFCLKCDMVKTMASVKIYITSVLNSNNGANFESKPDLQ